MVVELIIKIWIIDNHKEMSNFISFSLRLIVLVTNWLWKKNGFLVVKFDNLTSIGVYERGLVASL